MWDATAFAEQGYVLEKKKKNQKIDTHKHAQVEKGIFTAA